jgi:hypothetical protein
LKLIPDAIPLASTDGPFVDAMLLLAWVVTLTVPPPDASSPVPLLVVTVRELKAIVRVALFTRFTPVPAEEPLLTVVPAKVRLAFEF